MRHVATSILPAARLVRGYAETLIKGIPASSAAQKPQGRSGPIDTNHPVFVFGHLSLYPARALTMLGHDASNAALPPSWEPLFKAGAPCVDDPSGTIYPTLAEVMVAFFRGTDALIAAVAETDDALFLKPNPNEAARERFPTIGAAMNFYLVGHPMMHAGQVSAWRRCMGLPSAM